MAFQYVPGFTLKGDGETKAVQEELRLRTIHVSAPDATTVRIEVREATEFAGMDVDIVRNRIEWTCEHLSSRDVYRVRNGEGRCIQLEPEAGESMQNLIAGLADGHVTGPTASKSVMELLLLLEVENVEKGGWLEEHFPVFLAYYSKKLEGKRLRKVGSVIDS